MDYSLINRNVEPHLIDLMKQFPVVAIIGARQTGKTTLAKKIRPHFQYFDLEKPSHFDQITYDPEFFFTQFPEQLILDEAQKLPVLFDILRGVIDAQPGRPGRFIVTSSSSAQLLSHASETLAGRIAIVELGTLKINEYYNQPLSPFYNIFKEKLSRENLPSGFAIFNLPQVQHVWLKGGYPEPLLKDSAEYHETWMTNYQATYINRDIAQLFPKLNMVNFRRFLTILGKLSGTILNKSNIARALAVSEPTITSYLDITSGTFLWRQIFSYETNVTKSIVKMPKGQMRDTGLLHHLLRIYDIESLYSDPIAGHSFENFIIEEILRGIADIGISNADYFYYRTRGGAEIDLILHGKFGTLPIEIKLGKTVMRNQLLSLTKFIEEHQLPFGMVVNQSEKIEWLTPNIIQIPAGFL